MEWCPNCGSFLEIAEAIWRDGSHVHYCPKCKWVEGERTHLKRNEIKWNPSRR